MLNFDNGFLATPYYDAVNFEDSHPFTLELWLQLPSVDPMPGQIG
jgi:hypothetical protein